MNDIRDINLGIQKIESYFSNFLGSGFHLVAKKVDRKSFGNWIAVWQSESCILKFIQDRGNISAVIGPPWASVEPFQLEHFVELNLLIDFSKNEQVIVFQSKYDEYSVDKSLQKLSIALTENFPVLVSILNDEEFSETEKSVKYFNLQRLRKIYPNIK